VGFVCGSHHHPDTQQQQQQQQQQQTGSNIFGTKGTITDWVYAKKI
jgi:hypothetical protein